MPRTRAARRGRPAFTLVELLLVIGIIALLIAILLPTLKSARESARKTACMNNLRQWGQAFVMYSTQFRGTIPADGGEGDVATAPVGPWDASWLWFNAIPPMVGVKPYSQMQEDDTAGRRRLPIEGSNSLFVCPDTTVGIAVPGKDTVDNGYFLIYGTNAAGAVEQRRTFMCYVMNSRLGTSRPVKFTSLRPASTTVLMLEKRMRPGELESDEPMYGRGLGRVKGDFQRFTARHKNGGFLLFADGHVGYFDYEPIIHTPFAPKDYNISNSVVWDPFGPAN